MNYPMIYKKQISIDWSGIEDEDDYETREKKWYTYKNKFPNVSSKSQSKIN